MSAGMSIFELEPGTSLTLKPTTNNNKKQLEINNDHFNLEI
jgi:hypothetical protein